MDGWKYTAKYGRKESGFENLETRFQDCNLSRKQENKLSGWNENRLPFNQESKQAAKRASCLCGMNKNKEARKKTIRLCRIITVIPAFMLSVWNERKQSVHLNGWKTIKMYHYNSVLQ